MLTEETQSDPRLKESVMRLDVPIRVKNALYFGHVCTIGDLVNQTPESLFRLDQCGKGAIRCIHEALAKLGLSLKAG
jgi:DNA-directed RNA polymerase alpha subunit